jgi:hypothetical protein
MEFPATWSLDSTRHGFEKMESGLNGRAIDFAKFVPFPAQRQMEGSAAHIQKMGDRIHGAESERHPSVAQ